MILTNIVRVGCLKDNQLQLTYFVDFCCVSLPTRRFVPRETPRLEQPAQKVDDRLFGEEIDQYENGQRTPSHQMIEFMAQRLNTNWAYLTGLSDDSDPDCLFISRESDPLLFDLVQMVQNADSTEKARLLHYLKSFR